MSVPRGEIIEMCINLAQEKNLKASVKRNLKIVAVACIGVLVGGLVGWPRGLPFGVTAAAICAGIVGSGYKPVDEVIRDDMTQEQKRELADAVWGALRRINPDSVTDESALVTVVGETLLEEVVIGEMRNFFSKKMDLSLS